MTLGTAVIAATAAMAEPASAIVGGRPASESYPIVASVQRMTPAGPMHTCGGVRLDDRHILTAAHCVTVGDGSALPPDALRVRVGSADRTGGGHLAAVARVLPHADWAWGAPGRPVHDIAVLRLAGPPAPLATPPAAAGGVASGQPFAAGPRPPQLRVMGWGLTEPDRSGTPPIHLRELDTAKAPAGACAPAGMTAGEICIGKPDARGGPCDGDSGGPVAAPIPGLRIWVPLGLVSRGTAQHCGGGTYTVFTDLGAYAGWIATVIVTGAVPPAAHPRPLAAATGQRHHWR